MALAGRIWSAARSLETPGIDNRLRNWLTNAQPKQEILGGWNFKSSFSMAVRKEFSTRNPLWTKSRGFPQVVRTTSLDRILAGCPAQCPLTVVFVLVLHRFAIYSYLLT